MGGRCQRSCMCLVRLSRRGSLHPGHQARHYNQHELGEVSGLLDVLSHLHSTNVSESVVMVGIGAYVLVAWYLWQRHVYKGPKVNVQLQDQIHREILHHPEVTTISGVELEDAVHEQGHKPVKGD